MKKKSFFEYIFARLFDQLIGALGWLAERIGAHSALTKLRSVLSERMMFFCWAVFLFAFSQIFLFLFKKHVALALAISFASGCVVVACAFPRTREMLKNSFLVKLAVQLMDPNK